MALVRDGKEDVLRFGSDVTINLRAELAPSVEAPLVFAGYGLSAPDAGHDDLAGLDLKGKVAVYIAGTPAAITGPLVAHYQQAGVRWNALRAAGAIGAIAIPNPEDHGTAVGTDGAEPAESGDDARRSAVQRPRGNAGRRDGESGQRRSAVCRLRPYAGRAAGAGRREEAAAALRASRVPAGAGRARLDPRSSPTTSSALLPGSDPALAGEHVVLTAHLDHLGVGAAVNGDRIYNGAMDNASGIATLLEVARTLAAARPRPKRSVLFVAVTAEEHGLLGSRYFAGDPTVPKASIVANINMDMFLPLFPMKSVMVLGLDESDLGDRVREVARPDRARCGCRTRSRNGIASRAPINTASSEKGFPRSR